MTQMMFKVINQLQALKIKVIKCIFTSRASWELRTRKLEYCFFSHKMYRRTILTGKIYILFISSFISNPGITKAI